MLSFRSKVFKLSKSKQHDEQRKCGATFSSCFLPYQLIYSYYTNFLILIRRFERSQVDTKLNISIDAKIFPEDRLN